MPAPISIKTPSLFVLEHVGQFTKFLEYDLRRAGLCSPKQIKIFWDDIIDEAASTSILKKNYKNISPKRKLDCAKFDVLTSAMRLNQDSI